MKNPPINHHKRSSKPRHWVAHLASLQKSGLSRAEYCRQHKLSYHAMIYWQRKLASNPSSKETTLVPVSFGHKIQNHFMQPQGTALKVILPDKISIEVGDNFSSTTFSDWNLWANYCKLKSDQRFGRATCRSHRK